MQVIQTRDYENLSEKVAGIIFDQLKGQPDSTLGLATGSTPVGTYQLLKKQPEHFIEATTFNLDEYVGLKESHPQSYRYFMQEKLFNTVPVKASYIPNGSATDLQEECKLYEQKIQASGGIDLQLLGLGMNGHIGFNEPGTPFDSRTHVVELAESTRQANARFFNHLDEVPTQAITMGIETIMEAKKIVLLVSGNEKVQAFDRLFRGEIEEKFPASILRTHPNITVVHDL
nr:glucosamine-6-phosphate deaminase [Halalkalibacillus halophilus]